jgi:ubiquinone/menaquinone biosynthesis C-methylase UbiE
MVRNTKAISVAKNTLSVIDATTADRYRGAAARDYDATRRHQTKWKRESECLRVALKGASGTVLDIPIGTGRFIPIYRQLGFKYVIGMDVSQDMLEEARKHGGATVARGNILDIPMASGLVDWAVCVRLLNLISEDEMKRAVGELCRVARVGVVLSIRLGDQPTRRKMSITQTFEAFNSAIPDDWHMSDALDMQDSGYKMIRLER